MAYTTIKAPAPKGGPRMHARGRGNASGPAVPGLDRDARVLARSGKKQVLKRRFGLVSMIGLTLTNTTTWQSVIFTFSIGLANGGFAGLIYGCILCWIYSTLTRKHAGGPFHYAGLIATDRWKAPLSYVTGWISVAVWIAAPTLQSFLAANTILQLIAFLDPTFSPQPWQGLLLMWAFIIVMFIVNTILGAFLPSIQCVFLALHVIGFFGFLLPLANLGPHGNSKEIFTTFNNQGNWSSLSLAFLVGLQGNAGAFVGGDCAIHMAEEMRRAEVLVPRAMILSIALNGAMAFGITVTLCYVGGSLDALVSDAYPFMSIIQNVTGSQGATAALVSYISLMSVVAGCSSVAAGGRMTFSFARDKGLPFSGFLGHVDRRLKIPMRAIGVNCSIAALLGLIQLGSSVVLEIVLSLIMAGYFFSYLCVLVPLFYHRLTGNISDPKLNDKPGARMKWGPYRLNGWLGVFNNAFAVLYLIIVGLFIFWPQNSSPDASTMNYSCLLLGSLAIFSAVYYFLKARKDYKGPIDEFAVEVDEELYDL